MSNAQALELEPVEETRAPAAKSVAVRAEPVAADASILAIVERAALNPDISIEKMERLMAMYERVKANEAKAAYMVALAELQPELPTIERNGRIVIRDKNDNTKIIQSTPYALWEDINEGIRPAMARHGFTLSFRYGQMPDGKITVTGVLGHRAGHAEETTMVLTHDSTGSKNAVQAIASSYSYGKRYTACALLNITSRGEDDDGKAAGNGGVITEEQYETLRTTIVDTGADLTKFLEYFKIEKLEELPSGRFVDAITALKKKAKAAEKVS